MQKNRELENYLFNIIVIVAAIVSIVTIITNIIIGFPLSVNIKWTYIVLLSFFVYRFINQSNEKYYRLIYFLSVILIIIPIGWIESGGSGNNTIAYVFLLMICISIFFHDKLRTIMLSILIVIFTLLQTIEYFYPQVIIKHNPATQFYDRLFQVPLTLLGGFLLIKQFADAYNREEEKLSNYSKKLKKANEELEYMATRDGLTGLYNRRKFNDELNKNIMNEESINKGMFMVIFDIDYFKSINDTYGHIVGDKVLYAIARITEGSMPEDSIISRWGGDEFAIVYIGEEHILINSIENLYKNIRKINFDKLKRVTISSGITKIEFGEDIKSIFKRADDYLYEAKSMGRNRYFIN